jgi:hypothetical protein
MEVGMSAVEGQGRHRHSQRSGDLETELAWLLCEGMERFTADVRAPSELGHKDGSINESPLARTALASARDQDRHRRRVGCIAPQSEESRRLGHLIMEALSTSVWVPGSRYTASAILLIDGVAITGMDAFLRGKVIQFRRA